MSMVGFPLLLIPLAIYNIIVFLMPGVSLAEPLLTLTLMSGAEWPVTLSDILLALGILLLLLRGHQGRASRREISHRSSAVADRVRCGGRRIPAVAAIRHLDLFPAGAAGAGGFPVGHCAARAARNGDGSRGRVQRETPRTPAAAPEPRFDRTCRAGAGGRPVAEAVPPDRAEPKWCMPRSRRRDHRRRCRPRDCSRAKARRRRRTRRRADFFRRLDLDDLPGPDAGRSGPDASAPRRRPARRPALPAAGSRVCGTCSAVAISWVTKIERRDSPLVRHARPLNGRHHRHQRDAGGPFVREDAVICRLLWSIAA